MEGVMDSFKVNHTILAANVYEESPYAKGQ
jgi:S-ribosylhomocysteine lyase LuxS involved in autoinducer biosynthesis